MLSSKLPRLSSFLMGAAKNPKNKYVEKVHETEQIKLELVHNKMESKLQVDVDVDGSEFEEQLAEELERIERMESKDDSMRQQAKLSKEDESGTLVEGSEKKKQKLAQAYGYHAYLPESVENELTERYGSDK